MSTQASLPIDRRSGLDPARFAEEFLDGLGRPVVVTDALERHPARQRWTLDYLADRLGDEVVTATWPAPVRQPEIVVRMRLRDYIDYVKDPDRPPVCEVVTGDLATLRGRLYVASWRPVTRLGDDYSLHPYFVEDFTRLLTPAMKARLNGWVLVGPAGALSRLHFDALSTHAYLGQFYGTKRCVLFSPADSPYLYGGQVDPGAPDLEKFPLYAQATPFECVLQPGELVFMPANWWHYVVCLEPSITVSFNFINSTNFGAFFEGLGRLPFICADP
jgi:hypothetical protein